MRITAPFPEGSPEAEAFEAEAQVLQERSSALEADLEMLGLYVTRWEMVIRQAPDGSLHPGLGMVANLGELAFEDPLDDELRELQALVADEEYTQRRKRLLEGRDGQDGG